jgi:hypothetical protein
MAQFVQDYDYFINIEDDIFLPEESFNNIVEFEKIFEINEILLPNRLEESNNGEKYCVDLKVINGWTHQFKTINGKFLKVANNPHSAILILSRAKFLYALSFLKSNFREPILYNELDSAFAYFHSPFSLYRSVDLSFHYVIHLDRWLHSPGEKYHYGPRKNVFAGVTMSDFIPPILFRILNFFRRKFQ